MLYDDIERCPKAPDRIHALRWNPVPRFAVDSFNLSYSCVYCGGTLRPDRCTRGEDGIHEYQSEFTPAVEYLRSIGYEGKLPVRCVRCGNRAYEQDWAPASTG